MNRRPRSRRSPGFTLIEIMVVIAIIGLLASFVIVKYTDQQRYSNRIFTKAQIKEVSKAIDLYMLRSRRYPNTLEELTGKSSDGKGPEGGYMEAIPKDAWGNAFVYRRPGREGKAFDIISYGEDGVEGGSDEYAKDITNHDKE